MNLFLELRRHGKLAEKRHPMYEKSKFGKFWMYFMSVFWAGYLIFFGTTFAFAFDGGAKEAYHVMNSGLIFILALDFLLRLPFLKHRHRKLNHTYCSPSKGVVLSTSCSYARDLTALICFGSSCSFRSLLSLLPNFME